MKQHYGLALFVLAIGLVAAVGGQALRASAADPSGDEVLRRALEQARAAGSYRVSIDVLQTVYTPMSVLGNNVAPAEQSARISVEGTVGGPKRARFTLSDGEIRGQTPQNDILNSSHAREVLISDGKLYQRQGDQWVLQNDSSSAPGLTSDALMLLSVAKNVKLAQSIQTLGGTFERVLFTLDSDDVLAFMLQQLGRLDEQTAMQVKLNGLRYGGTGELWIDRNGLPARLALDLALERGGREAFKAHAVSTALYSAFGAQVPAEWFDPTIAPLSYLSTSPIPASGLTAEQTQSAGVMSVALVATLALCLFLASRTHFGRRTYATIVLVLILVMVTPNVVQAAQLKSEANASPEPQARSAVENMVVNMRRMSEQQRAGIAAKASDLPDQGDADGDGLPNGFELKLGTNPFAKDSDLDGLRDSNEVKGVDCEYGDGTVKVQTDPLNPDSNYDGLRDGDEFDHGKCRLVGYYATPYAWNDDNDQDGVPDGLDLSPFTKSDVLGSPNGANISFETVEGRELDYFEVQLVPSDASGLQYAYKSALEWPVDNKGLIQHEPISGTTGALKIAPFLQVTLEEDDAPYLGAMSQYGISVTQETTGVLKMVVPLAPVERGGRVYAFQAKVFQNNTSDDGVIRWRDMRLKYAVQGDVLRPDPNDSGKMIPSSTGSYGLTVYDAPYRITGVQASRQGGASSLVAGAYPQAGQRYDAGPAALLRAGLEAQFLSGRLSLSDIYNRFNITSTAVITERWGITQTFYVSPPRSFAHLDPMLLTTNVTTTRQVLDAVNHMHTYTPTLVIASEQRTATLNVDELPEPNLTDLTLTLCYKQMATSRTLKLATYRWDPMAGALAMNVHDAGFGLSDAPLSPWPYSPASGDWTMLGLDEVLKDIQNQFDEIYGQLEEFYNDAVTILQMAMTVWYQSQTVLQSIGALDLTNITDALSDPNFYLNILNLLDQYGLFNGLPSEFRQAVEFLLGVLNYPGGPLQWLQDQWNTIVMVGDEILGGFKDFGAGVGITPDSLIGFTQTAINVLTWLASVFDLGFLGDMVKVLSRLLEIFKKVQELWNTIQLLVTQGVGVVSDALNAALAELSSATGSAQVLGLIFSIASSLFSMLMQIASGNLSVLGVIGVILQAVVQIAIAVVLFVVGSIFPIGTIIAIAFALVQLITGFLQEYLGTVGTVLSIILDPIGSFLTMANPDPEPLAEFPEAPPVSSPMQFNTWPDQPLGGFVAGQSFGLEMTTTATMVGDAFGVEHSRAWMQLGRYATGDKFQVCGVRIADFLAQSGQIDKLPQYLDAMVDGDCREFQLMGNRYWLFTRNDEHSRSGVYGDAAQDFTSNAHLNVNPHTPAINGTVSADVSFSVKQMWENCGILGVDCDVYPERYETVPSVFYLYFDIMPPNVGDFWNWGSLTNSDPDADGLAGNPDDDVAGPDVNLCGNAESYHQFESEPGAPGGGDGLSDYFELMDYGTSPCLRDTDDDGLDDGQEFMIGTDPLKPDTDGDGLLDGEEVARWVVYANELAVPWKVEMGGAYDGLENPPAFPNPRLGNADGDGRSDKKERELKSSPNGFNISDMDLALAQNLVWGGGTRLAVTSLPWINDVAPAFSPVLTITLPITFTGVTRSASIVSKETGQVISPAMSIIGTPPNVYAWKLPPIALNTLVSATLTGLRTVVPADVVSVTVELSYTEAGLQRKETTVQPLLINRGAPVTTLAAPADDAIVSALYNPIRIQGISNDPEGLSSAEVCITTLGGCLPQAWKSAVVPSTRLPGWHYDWTPSADGTYYLWARATDAYGLRGAETTPISVHVDSTLPQAGVFDLGLAAYLSTTLSPETLATFTITGRITETTGAAYTSGVGDAVVLAQQIVISGSDYLPGRSVLRGDSIIASPGAASSAFSSRFSLPMSAFSGRSSPDSEGLYRTQLSARDRAGNTLVNSDLLNVIVDDTPPYVTVRPPQTISTTEIELGGHVDDTALHMRRMQRGQEPYPISQTVTAGDTKFVVDDPGHTRGRGYIVGDLNGDAIDDVVAVTWDPTKPLEAGIFFGRAAGYPEVLDLDEADVHIMGEIDFTGPYTYGPSVAINAPDLFDVNGDSIADLLIGDPNVNNASGRAYVLLGRRTWPTTTINLEDADWRLSVSGATFFGGSVASAGDVDGDGLSDVLVGAAQESLHYEVASLYLGQERGVPARQSRVYGRGCIGCPPRMMPNLAGLGDADGDGLSDFLLAGDQSVWLVNGRPKIEWPVFRQADQTSIGAFLANGQQQTVAPTGDVNGDGLRDMLIGDPLAAISRVFVVFGRRPENAFSKPFTLTTNADISYKELAGTRYLPLGEGLVPMGDLDRDGKDDYAFTGITLNGGGAIAISSQTPRLRDMSPLSGTRLLLGVNPASETGKYMSSGDVNGDAIRDVLLGAPGAAAAYLFDGNPPGLFVAGTRRLDVGVSGPILTPTLPYTATLPMTWRRADLERMGAPIGAFSATLTFDADGDYRVYARAIDRAGNMLPDKSWYVRNVLVNTSAVAMPAMTGTLTTPAMFREGYLRVSQQGIMTATEPIQHLRVYDGEHWTRMPLMATAPGVWSNESNIERSDQRLITLRAVARDAFGNSAQLYQRITTDTLIARPVISANLPVNHWFTNVTPTLVLTWNTVADAGGPVQTFAVIDMVTKTVPTTLVTSNQVTRSLNAPGAWYAHLRILDSAGNQRLLHAGPYVVNRTKTPTAILPDGWFETGEYVEGMVTSYDPYAAAKPMVMVPTWDARHLYLGFTGADWNLNQQLAVYLDARADGGMTQSLGSRMPGREPTHTLPFAADYALVVSGPTSYTLYAYSNPLIGWVASPAPASFAVADEDTEIVLDRDELGISDSTPVSLLAYMATDAGVAAVIPASARLTTTQVLSGPVTFADSLHWSALVNGYPATLADRPPQWIAPLVSVKPSFATQLVASDVVPLTVHIVNPDLVSYYHQPLTVTLGSASPQLMKFTGVVSGATCVSCPPDGREWVMQVNVSQNAPTDVVLAAKALTPPATGVFTVPISATLAYQGLPTVPQPPATTAYVIDNNVAQVGFNATSSVIVAKPGPFSLPIFASLSSSILSCKQQLSINKGGGFQALGTLGSVTSVTDTLPIGYNQAWTLQVIADSGQTSTVSVTVMTDGISPTVQITPASVLTGPVSLLYGVASDNIALSRVQVSLNGGMFQPATLAAVPTATQASLASAADPVVWALPVNAVGMDGERVRFVARAVDSAGNVGPQSAPVTVTFDTTGPAVTVTQSTSGLSGVISGTVTDGSGVAQIQVSLDGGVSYQPATRFGFLWWFNRAAWAGSTPIEWVVIRALDVYGNVSQVVVAGAGGPYRVFLPIVIK